jgi:hypothetical protein
MNILCEKLRKKLVSYITGNISLSEFEDWFVPTLWTVHKRNDEKLSDMVYEIELRLAEYSNGDWSENELKEHLQEKING